MKQGTRNKERVKSWIFLAQAQTQRYGEKKAFVLLDDSGNAIESVSFHEIDRRARAMAIHLQAQCPPGQRALLLFPSSIEYIVAFFACLYARVIAVPVFAPRSNKHNVRLERIAADCEPSVVLAASKPFRNIDGVLQENSLLASIPWLVSDAIPTEDAPLCAVPNVHEDEVAFLQYTSGSTGRPKGVVVTHRNLLYNEAMIAHAFNTTPASTYVTWLPIYHDMGLIGNILHAFYAGATCVLMSPVSFLQRPIRWLRAISDYRAEISGGPNFAYDLCTQKIDAAHIENLNLETWRVAFNGSEPVRHTTLERFGDTFAPARFDRRALYPCYGMAETTLIVSGGASDAPPIYRWFDQEQLGRGIAKERAPRLAGSIALVGCGGNLLQQRLVIVDPKTCRLCDDGIVGEIWVAGEHVAAGYWNNPDASRETFDAYLADNADGPFLRTGDLGFMWDGELFVAGRLKDVIIIRGANYYPHDIESTVEQASPAIRVSSVAALSINDNRSEEKLIIVAEIERTYLRCIDPEIVKRQIRQAVIERHEIAAADVVLIRPSTLPKTSSGKVQRSYIRELYLKSQLSILDAERTTAVQMEAMQ